MILPILSVVCGWNSTHTDTRNMSGIHPFFARRLSAAVVFVCLAVGCSDVGYNPYVQNDGNRPIGKQIEDVMEDANDAVSTADARFENAFN